MEDNKNLLGSYITIQVWMLECLRLSGNELLVFALIYSYCRNGGGVYYGSLSLIEKWTNSSKRTAITTLQKLMEKGLIVKRIEKVYGKDNILYDLSPNISPLVKKFHQRGEDFAQDSENFSPNNICNNIDNNIDSSNSLIINNNPIPTTPYIPQGGLESELSRSELIFEEFRKFYKGTKRGLKTEFENFKKKNKDWKEVLPTLLEKYKAQKEAKEKIRLNGGFVPQEKNLQTYLNQRCWEEEINTTNLERYGTISTQQTDTAEKPHERVLREMLEFTRNNVPELC